jgi:hypothetical protein
MWSYLWRNVAAVSSDKIFKELNNRKYLTVGFVGIVVSGLVSGSYYNVGSDTIL